VDPHKYPEHPRNYQNIVLLPFSSGTLGKQIGVELTHRNIVSNSLMLNSLKVVEPTTDNWQDVFICTLPFFHIYGMTLTLISKLALGAKIVTLPGFNPGTFLNALEKYKGTVLHLVPPHVSFLANSDKVEKKHTESIRYIICGAGPITKPDVERLLDRIPNAAFIHGYGLTECSPAVFMSKRDNVNHASAGILMPNTESKIAALGDISFQGLGPHQSGEILVRGPQVMDRYLNNREATKRIFTRDGFLRTGDIGHYDDNEEFYVTDRLKELMKVKGFQVSPVELEDLLKVSL
jgi:acyl-CoA synthetase (AMP-forming)/AMP-acid ligase II